MPPYGGSTHVNSPLQAVAPQQAVPVTLVNAETPVAGQASLPCAVMARGHSSQLTPIAVRFFCPLGMGAGVFQIQDSDFSTPTDNGADFGSLGFNGANPGTVGAANFNASGVARIELIIRARFLRVLCVTAPSNPVTVTVE